MAVPVFVRRHPGIALALAVAGVGFLVLVGGRWSAANALVVWNVSALAYLGFTWWRMGTASLDHLRQRASELDMSDSVVLILSVLAALASLAGIGFELLGMRGEPPEARLAGAALAMATVLISWAFLYTLFTLHYAHRYYSEEEGEGGLLFPEERAEPGYWDFLYFSFTIGVASQTADVVTASVRMRRLVLFHAVLSFLFNTTILALAINAGASLV